MQQIVKFLVVLALVLTSACSEESIEGVQPEYTLDQLLAAPIREVKVGDVTLSMVPGYRVGPIGEALLVTSQIFDKSRAPLDPAIKVERLWTVSGSKKSRSFGAPTISRESEVVIQVEDKTSFKYMPGKEIVLVLKIQWPDGEARLVRSHLMTLSDL
jgi:hypothetical protein